MTEKDPEEKCDHGMNCCCLECEEYRFCGNICEDILAGNVDKPSVCCFWDAPMSVLDAPLPRHGNLRRWLTGQFVCRKCGREMHSMTFGFGEGICPDCYHGEHSFIFFDKRYWLNRIAARLMRM